jgi:hypothetical protein
MQKFQVFARPWWVNLSIIVPGAAYLLWRRMGLQLAWRRTSTISAFALAFGFVEAAVVVYLRAAAGLLPGYNAGTLADVRRLSNDLPAGQIHHSDSPEPADHRSNARDRHFGDAGLCRLAGSLQGARALGSVPLGFRDMGYHVLCQLVGYRRLALHR